MFNLDGSILNLNKLRSVKEILVHKSCPDGTASAILLKDALPWASVRFVQYGTAEHKELVPGEGQLFCDIGPHASNFQAFIDAGAIVLDHHATAREVTEAFGDNGAFGDEKTEPGVCGAVLAFRCVWDPLFKAGRMDGDRSRAAHFSEIAGIRDTWMNHDPRFGESCVQAEMLRFYPEEEWLEHSHPFSPENASLWQERTKLGQLLYAKHLKNVAKCIEGAWRFTSSEKATRVVVFQDIRMSSDVAEVLGETVDLVMGFDYLVEYAEGKPPTRKVIFSTRSHTHFNCAEFAKKFGGGGHTRAAGFNLVLDGSCWDDDARDAGALAQQLNPYSLAEVLVGP